MNKQAIKIEMDLINGMMVVESFSSDTEVGSGLKIKDFLKDEFEGTLGFEVTKEEAQEVLDLGYSIKGL